MSDLHITQASGPCVKCQSLDFEILNYGRVTNVAKLLARRLRELVPSGSAAEVAAAAKIRRETLSRLMTGAEENPTLRTIARLAEVLEVSIGYLLSEDDQGPQPFKVKKPGGLVDYTPIPLLKVELCSGNQSLRLDDIAAWYALPTTWLRSKTVGRVVMARIGRSKFSQAMFPLCEPGMIVTFDLAAVNPIVSGDVYVVQMDPEEGGVALRRVFREGDHLVMAPENLRACRVRVSHGIEDGPGRIPILGHVVRMNREF